MVEASVIEEMCYPTCISAEAIVGLRRKLYLNIGLGYPPRWTILVTLKSGRYTLENGKETKHRNEDKDMEEMKRELKELKDSLRGDNRRNSNSNTRGGDRRGGGRYINNRQLY
ncbi:Hypothetical predicted protein [Mytilus galloprovincialis]|uniref:Uncharacterized protein n=1 Tax=Mytilus galloprovincialis TaxID=29158 RepID=A0A8B6D2E1_MYTGA|nr:Hypothetical predicted protein [Mytilus galloprovincialis]